MHMSVHASLFAMHVCMHLAGTDTLTSQQLQDGIWCWWRPHPVNGELDIIIYPATLGMAGQCEHAYSTFRLLPFSWLEGGA